MDFALSLNLKAQNFSGVFPAAKLVYETHPLKNTACKPYVYYYFKMYGTLITVLLIQSLHYKALKY